MEKTNFLITCFALDPIGGRTGRASRPFPPNVPTFWWRTDFFGIGLAGSRVMRPSQKSGECNLLEQSNVIEAPSLLILIKDSFATKQNITLSVKLGVKLCKPVFITSI